jgi:LSD1 subclass zinc finger protein
MNSRLTVSTDCPTCGAPLDFTEGSRAIQCGHCRSRLLVTGRKQLLSYFISPKLDIHRAVAKALLAQKEEEGGECRVIEPYLYFIPYYRLTGHDFLWERSAPKPKREPIDLSAFSPDPPQADMTMTLQAAADLLGDLWEFGKRIYRGEDEPLSGPVESKRRVPAEPPVVAPRRNEPDPVGEEEEMAFRDRYVEKNFIACDLKGWGSYSLGVRPAVLRLELFRKAVLEEQGKIVGVTVSSDEAFSQGMRKAEPENVLYRQVLSRVLSLIYFPFWVIRVQHQGEERLIFLDAVSERVIHLNAPISLLECLDRPAVGEAATIGFRPLACPNCGWDFPFTPEEILFFCTSCAKGWQIEGSALSQIDYQVASPPYGVAPSCYLPFWVLEAQVEESPSFRFFLPAFRYRRLKLLGDLAKRLSEAQPVYTVSTDSFVPSQGGCYDQEDAALLARFTWAGLLGSRGMKVLEEKPLSLSGAMLTWLPFRVEGNVLRDPFTGTSLPQNLFV